MTSGPITRDLERAVRAYVAEGSGLDVNLVIPGNDPGPAPLELYASVLLIRMERQGIDGYYLDGLEATILGSVFPLYSVQWYRRGARDAAMNFHQWASSPLGQLATERRGLTFQRCTAVRQLDEIISDQWEERAGLDLTMSLVQYSTQTLGTIKTVPVAIAEAGDILVEVS